MTELAKALPWVAFWAVAAPVIWCEHTQYMAGHETTLWGHRTPEEIRLREAAVRQAELKAGIQPKEKAAP